MSEKTPSRQDGPMCPEHVYGRVAWQAGGPCGRPVKRDGLCGIHAAAKDRRAADKAETASREMWNAPLCSCGARAVEDGGTEGRCECCTDCERMSASNGNDIEPKGESA